MASIQPTILIVDDERRLGRSLEILFREEGPFNTLVATDYYQALELLKHPVDLVLTDLTMPGKSGIDLLKDIVENHSSIPVILMTAYSTVESAVTAMKEGAADYIVKPFDNDELLALIRKTLHRTHSSSVEVEASENVDRFGDILGGSNAMQEVYRRIQRAAQTDATVLITGESGTGKELVAKAIHYSGGRKAKPFVALNCAAVSETLLESELFGHEKGAFTGAVRSREGRFELAQNGTLFLDEIGEMDPALQVKLLRVLQEKRFERVGGQKTLEVDVRIIAATNRDLYQAVKEGQFREDLFYRINVVHIPLPSLRERLEDLPMLVGHFINEKCRRLGIESKQLNDETMESLLKYPFPGNIRELENMIERAVIMSRNSEIEMSDLPIRTELDDHLRLDEISLPVDRGFELVENVKEKLERDLIERAIAQNPRKSNTEIAEMLGTSRRILEARIKQYNLRKR